jgi:hypothetical protein
MSKKKSMMNLQKLTDIMKPMTRLQLNKFVSNLNKELKITNASKMKREDLEAELLTRADIIIDMIDKDKDLKLFDTTTKPRAKKISQEELDKANERITKLTKLIKRTRDRREIESYMKEIEELNKLITHPNLQIIGTKKEVITEQKKKENDDEFRKLGEQFEKLNEERMRIMNQSEPDLGRVNEIIKETNDLLKKQSKLI